MEFLRIWYPASKRVEIGWLASKVAKRVVTYTMSCITSKYDILWTARKVASREEW